MLTIFRHRKITSVIFLRYQSWERPSGYFIYNIFGKKKPTQTQHKYPYELLNWPEELNIQWIDHHDQVNEWSDVLNSREPTSKQENRPWKPLLYNNQSYGLKWKSLKKYLILIELVSSVLIESNTQTMFELILVFERGC